jgi:hypothetical protein
MESEVQQDRQRMYNVTLRCVRITVVTREKKCCVFCCATCHCQQYKNNKSCAKMFLWRIYVTGNNETYLSLHTNCPIFLSDFNQIWSFSANFHASIQYQIPRKSTCSRTDTADRHVERRDEAYRRFSLFMRTRLCRWSKCWVLRVMPWRHICK